MGEHGELSLAEEQQQSNGVHPESASSQQKFVGERDAQFNKAVADQMPQEEKINFYSSHEVPSLELFDGDPSKDPAKFLDFLKRKNPNYAYDDTFTPEMVKKAVGWALDKGFNPLELSPAQIQLSQNYIPGEKTAAETAEEVMQERLVNLRNNLIPQLKLIVATTGNLYFHATPVLENVKTILEKGLSCDHKLGLYGSAEQLNSLPATADETSKKQTVETNIEKLANPHRGYRYEVIIELPPLTSQQQADYQERKARGETASPSSYFVQKLADKAEAQGNQITYNAILPSQYIKGYIDLDTGQFTPR